MQATMAVMLDAMGADVRRMEFISLNLANLLTPGYQRQMLVARAQAGADAGGFSALLAPDRAGTPSADGQELVLMRDSRSATLKNTGQAWDLALASRGYFEVASPTGPVYTRRGQFQLDTQGRLVTQEGWPVMGLDGEVSPGTEPVTVDAAGTLRAGDRVVARLRIVDAANTEGLRPAQPGYFSADGSVTLLPESDRLVRQGHLENANVSSSTEMLELMKTMRHFESVGRVLQGYDDMIGMAVRKLGEV